MRKIFIIFAYLLSSGCAITDLERDQKLHFYKSDDAARNVTWYEGVWFDCESQLVSGMLSPIIPLPPVIPTFWMDSKSTKLNIDRPSDESYLKGFKLIGKSGEIIFEHNSLNHEHLKLGMNLPYSCRNLDQVNLVLMFEKKSSREDFLITKKLIYESGKMRFGWAYLSA
ncbi:hypothetical protein GNX18_04425 [Microbulbifer sp. SH-1]|uniref:hypothetical protein n=1 Tax=Microbulbifer sp. SH-1 TaxID=2681547 RepID=UPI00140C13DA|nr:hypothetical protein [Microbulbifer sp. SH-1]QIL89090.1 hypothetical protein GNX18_04425 [Microbulbifer sp. SH-1]